MSMREAAVTVGVRWQVGVGGGKAHLVGGPGTARDRELPQACVAKEILLSEGSVPPK